MKALNAAINAAGNQRRLAKMIGTWPQTVNRWIKRYNGEVPSDFVIPIFMATGVTPHELRPDLHPTPMSGIPENATPLTKGKSD